MSGSVVSVPPVADCGKGRLDTPATEPIARPARRVRLDTMKRHRWCVKMHPMAQPNTANFPPPGEAEPEAVSPGKKDSPTARSDPGRVVHFLARSARTVRQDAPYGRREPARRGWSWRRQRLFHGRRVGNGPRRENEPKRAERRPDVTYGLVARLPVTARRSPIPVVVSMSIRERRWAF